MRFIGCAHRHPFIRDNDMRSFYSNIQTAIFCVCCICVVVGCSNSDSGPNSISIQDVDFDSVPDNQDNCVTVVNTNQSDIDSNGIGDVCDPQFKAQVMMLVED